MRSIGDLIYHVETTDLDFIDITEDEAVKLSTHLLRNLRDYHEIPGKVWEQFAGICYWHRDNGFITDKQHYWLIVHLKEYIGQRQYTLQEMM